MSFNKKDKTKEYTPQEVFAEKEDQQISKYGLAVSRSKLMGRAMLFGAFFLILAMALLYVFSLINTGYGSFSIRVGDKDDIMRLQRQIALSETRGFSNPTVYLESASVDEMNNISYPWMDVDEICSYDGSNNGENYLAYSFYLKNTGTESFYYSSAFNILQVTRGVDEAVRVLIRKNDQTTIYAKQSKYGTVESFPANCTNFYSEDKVLYSEENYTSPGQVDRYSVIIWLEGEDAECIDAILKGIMQFEMAFEIVD